METSLKNIIPIWPFYVFFASAIFCLDGSTTNHIFECLSDKANRFFNRLDYAGVVILIYGSIFPVIIYQFWCSHFYQIFYAMVNGVISLLVFIICMGEKIYTKKYFTVKCIMFGILGISDIIIFPHLYINE